MNRVFLFGKLSFIPNRLQTKNGTLGATFSMECLDSSGFNNAKSFIRVTAWGKVASFIVAQNPGVMLFVEGRLTTYKITNSENKNTYALQVTADKIFHPDEKTTNEEPIKSTVVDSPFMNPKASVTEAEFEQAFPHQDETDFNNITPIFENDVQLEEESDD